MIKKFDYLKSLKPINSEVTIAIDRVLNSGKLILGPESEAFEEEFADFTGSRFCIGVNSGTSALIIAFMALGIGEGDEVITVSNTCVPTISAIEMTGAKPVFVDVKGSDLLIDIDKIAGAVSKRTKAIVPVHLWGNAVEMDKLTYVAKKYNLKVIEDCAQAAGTLYKGEHVGNFGNIGCFSFYPTKNLGAYGDAGAVVTDDGELARKVKMIRNYGYDKKGVTVIKGANFRISEIQSAILRVKLKHLSRWIERRREIAGFYINNVKNKKVKLPYVNGNVKHSFHQFVIRTGKRDDLCNRFDENGIEFGIHYPVPVHKMPYYSDRLKSEFGLKITEEASGEIISIPVHEALDDREINKIVDVIDFF